MHTQFQHQALDGGAGLGARATVRPVVLRIVSEPPRIGLIHNPHAHRNRPGRHDHKGAGLILAEPPTPGHMNDALRRFAALGVDRLIVDGGDGTVREVLSRAPQIFGRRMPALTILPTGKTNALALDLGARPGWTLEAAMAATRTLARAPLEVVRTDIDETLRGFLFGAGIYVDAVRVAQSAHKAHVVDSLAVGWALAAVAGRMALGWPGPPAEGEAMRVGYDSTIPQARRNFLWLASTLERLPLKLKPFGAMRPGLKVLEVAGPPARLGAALPAILAGRHPAWLDEAGYRRHDPSVVRMQLETPFVLDGEVYEGGPLRLSEGAPITFHTP